MIIDLHCHTRRSFDAFTTERELIRVCTAKNIQAIAITEHDAPAQYDSRLFATHGITVIPGCEFTTDRGAHIIGLFVSSALKPGCEVSQVLAHIEEQRGIILIPHPFKPGSGVCDLYSRPEPIFRRAHLAELYNGGYRSSALASEALRAYARDLGVRLVAASDSHRPEQIGYLVTEIACSSPDMLRTALLDQPLRMLVDANVKKRPRRLNSVQRSPIYQQIIERIPRAPKRLLKVAGYRLTPLKAAALSLPNFRPVEDPHEDD